MKPTKYSIKARKNLIAVAALTGALTFSAKADVIKNLGEFSTPNQGDTTGITDVANANGVDSGVSPDDKDLTYAGRITPTSLTLANSFGTFAVTINSDNTESLTFNLTAGYGLAGVAVHAGGGQTDRLWSINDESIGVDEGAFFGHQNGQMYQGLSNFDIFVEQVPIPEPSPMALYGVGAISLMGVMVLRHRRHHCTRA